jgi:hypothetical protein
MKRILLLSAVVALSAAAYAGEGHEHSAAKPSKEFEMVKGLVGDWKGTGDMMGKKAELTSTFRLTAAGSAIVETMDAGTPHEMTNVYHDVNGKLMMTHYCSMGNAPEMKVENSSDKSISLEAIKAHGIDPKKTPHMHSLVYEMPDKDHLLATWKSSNMGHEHEAPVTFTYTRVASAEKAK